MAASENACHFWKWLKVIGFPGGSVVKNPPANEGDAGDTGSIPALGRSPGEGNGNPLQYFAWEIPWTESLVDYSPWGHKEQDMTE